MPLKMPSLVEAIYDSLNMYSNVPNQSQLNQIQLILTTYKQLWNPYSKEARISDIVWIFKWVLNTRQSVYGPG